MKQRLATTSGTRHLQLIRSLTQTEYDNNERVTLILPGKRDEMKVTSKPCHDLPGNGNTIQLI